VKARAADLGFDDNQSALLEAAKAPTPEAQVEALERRAERPPGRPAQTSARPLKNLEYFAAGELAKWIKQTTPNDRTRVIRMLRECAAIKVNTSPDNFYPIRQMQLAAFNGESWEQFGDIVSG
jgi:hypothetical protein